MSLRFGIAVLVVGAWLGLLLSLTAFSSSTPFDCPACGPAHTQFQTTHSGTIPDAGSGTTRTVYLPAVMAPVSRLIKTGVDFGLMAAQQDVMEQDFPVARAMGPGWIRVWLAWDDVEAVRGTYHWEKYDALFEQVARAKFQAMVVVYHAPSWAAKEACGPIDDTEAFAAFLRLAITRYRDAVAAWEFINEPDGRAPLPDYGPAIGCWGLHPDVYAAQLGQFYRTVRALDTNALVFFGGLAYDNWAVFERNFFPAALDAGAGPHFDGVSLHYYPINPAEFPDISYKIRAIQDIMAQRGLTGKRIWITETSMWVNTPGGDPLGNLDAQHNYILTEYSRAFCAGVDNIFWFAVRQERADPPLHRWLIDLNHQPDNAYETFRFYNSLMDGRTCVGPVQQAPEEVEGYHFQGGGRSVYVLWSQGITRTVQIPAQTDGILSNRDGTITRTIPLQDGMLNLDVGQTPVLLQVNQ